MKVYMQSLGCAKNQVDSEMILGTLKDNITLVKEPTEAELIIINTCAFIEPARKEAIETILEMVEYKQDNKKFGTLKQYVVNINNRYVERKTTRKCYMTPYKQYAKVYKAHDASELEEKFKGYKHGSNVVIVEEI